MSLLACGDDDTPTDAGGDTGGPVVDCPDLAPGDALMAPCCYRTSNAARLDAPELRLTAIDFEAPRTLANPIVNALIQAVLDDETFNWLVRLDLGAAPSMTTGYGRRSTGDNYVFAMGDAPTPPDDPSRWDPVMLDLTLDGEMLQGSHAGTIILPITMADVVVLELPMRALRLEATLSDDRTCVGTRRPSGFDTSAGRIVTYVTVEDAAAGRIDVDPINTFFCNFIADISDPDTPCTDIPRDEWTLLPDSLCDTTTCTTGTCDPMTDCNAWEMSAGFAAAGVEIE